jgi:peptidyl-dipeptidase Dcp
MTASINQATGNRHADNPLLQVWDADFGLPPFSHILPGHFIPAFEQALPAHLAEINSIASNAEPPDFDNTLAEFDRSGRLLERITLLFHNLTASETSDDLRAVQLEMAPRLAAHENAIFMHAGLFSCWSGFTWILSALEPVCATTSACVMAKS